MQMHTPKAHMPLSTYRNGESFPKLPNLKSMHFSFILPFSELPSLLSFRLGNVLLPFLPLLFFIILINIFVKSLRILYYVLIIIRPKSF